MSTSVYPYLRRVPSILPEVLENPEEKKRRQVQQEVDQRIAILRPQRIPSTPPMLSAPGAGAQATAPPPAPGAGAQPSDGQPIWRENLKGAPAGNSYIARVPSSTVEAPPLHVDDEMAEERAAAFNAGTPRQPTTRYADPRLEHAMGNIAAKRITAPIPPPMGNVIDEGSPLPNPSHGPAATDLPVKAMREPEPGRSMHHGGKGDSRWKDGLHAFLAALASQQQSTGNGKHDFFNRLAAGAGGFGVGMFNPQLVHDLQYRKDLALYDERQNRQNQIDDRDYKSRKLESDLLDADSDRGYRNAMVKNILTDNEQRALDAKNKNAAEVVKLAQKQRTRVPKSAVVGTAFESFADAVPKADANLEEILKAAQFGFVPNTETQAALGATLGGSFPDGFGKVAPEKAQSIHWFHDTVTGEIKYGTLDKNGNPTVKIPEGDARLTPKPASTRTEDTKIWNDKNTFESSKQDLHTARSRVSQLQAVVNAIEKGDTSSNPNYSPEANALLAASDTAETKSANARAALQKARDDESAIKNKLTVYMNDKTREHQGRWKAYWKDDWPAVEIADGAPGVQPQRAPSKARSTEKTHFPASRLAEIAGLEKLTVAEFRKKLAREGIPIDETQ